MSRQSGLLFGVVALQLKLITREQFLEGAGIWLNDLDLTTLLGKTSRTLAAILQELQFMDAAALETAEAALQSDSSAPSIEKGLREALLEMRPPGDVRAWLEGLSVRPDEGAFTPVPRDERYELVREIARGGLGRVMEAKDRHLCREVAVKLVLGDLTQVARERFVREARVTARLGHPNIVPVYDFDEFPGPDGARHLMLCMKRVTGRDLGVLLKEIQRDPEAAGRWSQARLLGVFQDICQGMAFAHDHGILHRDLKPSNIMIGDYGETLIVDWGLAKEIVSAHAVRSPGSLPSGESAPASPDVTMEGDLLGTPLYMSPEQASGLISEMDARSDIFSLGGILFTILTFRSPFPGGTRDEVLRFVRSGQGRIPSRIADEVRATAVDIPGRPATIPEPVSPDLDAICARALAYRKEDRFASARELHDEVQLFLEGVKERERKQAEARERVETGLGHFKRYRALLHEIAAQETEVKEWVEKIKPHQPPEEKRPLWDAEARLRALREERIGAFTGASAEFGQALVVDPASVNGAEGKCELFLDRFLEAEKKRDREEMLLNRNTLLQYDQKSNGVRLAVRPRTS